MPTAVQCRNTTPKTLSTLVTGATGFIGRALIDALLQDGHSVRALVRSERAACTLPIGVEARVGDLAAPESFTSITEHVDVVFHLGAAVAGSWPDHLAATVGGTRAMLEESLAHHVKRFIHVSSVAAAETRSLADGEAMTERTPLAKPEGALGPYARGKAEAEQLVHEASERGLSTTIVRAGLVYGPGRVLFEHFGAGGRGRRLIAYGSAKQRVPMISLDSLVDALLRLPRQPTTIGRTYLVTDDAPERAQYLQWLNEVSGTSFRCTYLPVEPIVQAAHLLGFVRKLPGLSRLPQISSTKLQQRSRSFRYDASALMRDTGWKPNRDLRSSLQRAVEAEPAALYPHRCLRVGIIGAGNNAYHHLHSLRKMRGVKIIGVVDKRAGQAAHLARQFNLSCHYEDRDVFYRETRPDVVHVVTPPRTHCQVAVEAMSRGAHVLCEKPMAMSVEECKIMRETAMAHQRMLAVPDPGCDHSIANAAQAICEGAIGEVVHVDTNFSFDLRRLGRGSPGYEQRASWLEKLPGGLMEDLAPHALHATLELAGDPHLELAWSDVQFNDNTGTRSCNDVRLALRGNKTTANINLSLSIHPAIFMIYVYGTKGTIHIDVQNMLHHRLRLGRGPRTIARGLMMAKLSTNNLWQIGRNATLLMLGCATPPGHLQPLFDRFYASLATHRPLALDTTQSQRVVELLREIWPDRKTLCLADAG